MTDTHVEFKFVLFTLKMQTSHFFRVCTPEGGMWSQAFLAETVETE